MQEENERYSVCLIDGYTFKKRINGVIKSKRKGRRKREE